MGGGLGLDEEDEPAYKGETCKVGLVVGRSVGGGEKSGLGLGLVRFLGKDGMGCEEGKGEETYVGAEGAIEHVPETHVKSVGRCKDG